MAHTVKEKLIEMEESAKREALTSTAWFDLEKLATLAKKNVPELDAQLEEWKRAGLLFSVIHCGVELYPSYAFEDGKVQPREALGPILAVLSLNRAGWGIAYWFSSINGSLAGCSRPQDKLRTEPDSVLLAAQDEVLGITHG